MAKNTPGTENDLAATAVSHLLNCAYSTVVKYARQGKLPHRRDSANRRLFRREDVLKFQKDREAKQQQK